MGKLGFLAGMAAGYVLGARAGKQRYAQIKTVSGKVWNSQPVQKQVASAKEAARTQRHRPRRAERGRPRRRRHRRPMRGRHPRPVTTRGRRPAGPEPERRRFGRSHDPWFAGPPAPSAESDPLADPSRRAP